ncbi:MAG: agmatinase [Rubrobacteraceae bacterium]
MDQSKLDEMTRKVMSYSKHMDFKTFSGIATFFRANLCDDWLQIDVALVGLPSDAGLTQRTGARHGPREVRNQSCNVLYYNPLTKVIPFELARIADIGDVPLVSAFNLENVIAEIHEFYRKLHQAGVVPVTAGGDHSITYPILKALGADRPVGLVHIDAHIDATDRIADSTLHHGGPFKNAVLDGVLDPKRTIHIAIRDPATEFEQFAYETGMTVIDIDRFYDLGVQGVVAEARRVIGDAPVYISFDIDGLDPAYAPGTGTPAVGGITTYEAKRLLQGLRGLDIVGGDVVEVSPPFDSAGITALAGAQLMFEILCLAAEAFAKRPKQ